MKGVVRARAGAAIIPGKARKEGWGRSPGSGIKGWAAGGWPGRQESQGGVTPRDACLSEIRFKLEGLDSLSTLSFCHWTGSSVRMGCDPA